MKNLTSISEHSDYLENTFTFDAIKWDLHRKRVEFGKQPLEKWMFIPCDEDGDVLEEKSIFADSDKDYLFESDKFDAYQKAKERCIFEGFEVQNTKDWIEFYGGIRVYIPSTDLGNMVSIVFRESDPMNKTIEDLVKYKPELTPTALKTLGL